MKLKLYKGIRARDGLAVFVLEEGVGFARPLKHFVHHSPTGFECGYEGSGPADLALSIAADVLGPETERVKIYGGTVGQRAWNIHQVVKRLLVARLPGREDWLVEESEVRTIIEAHEEAAARRRERAAADAA